VKAPIVFISYSRAPKGHAELALKLAKRLIKDKLDAE